MIYYCQKQISPIKVSISKLLFEELNEDNNIELIDSHYIKTKSTSKSLKSQKSGKKNLKYGQKSSKSVKSKKKSFPPKKTNSRKTRKNSFDEKNDKKQMKLLSIVRKRRQSIKNNAQNNDKESIRSDKVRKRKSILDYQGQMLNTHNNLLKQEKYEIKIDHNKENKGDKKRKEKENNNKPESYDDYELNNMSYYDACNSDKRSCLQTYWSIIKREHYVIFTFISRNDYNLFYIKIERFFILICTELTMNGMFFVHETMYKKQTGNYSFAQKIPQIIFSLLVSHAIEVILCFMGMTDKHYYQIKELPKKEKDDKRIFNILDCVKRKLIGFFVFTFLVFLFHWYFISAFCAVYQNTQLIFLRDTGISILTSLVDPFILYGITCILRIISLSKFCKKKLACVYKLSDILPIF